MKWKDIKITENKTVFIIKKKNPTLVHLDILWDATKLEGRHFNFQAILTINH